jgi:hypothetical protein
MCSERMRDHALGRLLRSSLSVTTCEVSRTCDSAPEASERRQEKYTVRHLILDFESRSVKPEMVGNPTSWKTVVLPRSSCIVQWSCWSKEELVEHELQHTRQQR